MKKAFVYDPLHLSSESIRLLRILPGIQTDEIHCRLDQFAPSQWPRYCAVSYSWGEPGDLRRLVLNHQQFHVRQNLWWLLQHLRHLKEERQLWIDAICIDQTSIKERNHQVGLMGTIYQRADTVVVWLGLPTEDSKLALEFLTEHPNTTHAIAIVPSSSSNEFGTGQMLANPNHANHNAKYDRLYSGPEYKNPGRWGLALGSNNTEAIRNKWRDIDPRKWLALASLCKREYWHRTWIIQEILLASRIELLCGDDKISWKALEHMANVIPRRRDRLMDASVADTVAEICDSLPIRYVGHRLKQQPASLSNLLDIYQNARCLDSRDKVYAMLALASDCRYGSALAADYSKDIFQLFKDVMLFCTDIPPSEKVRFSLLVTKVLGSQGNPS